ncbi:hypothetical protein CEUSTIGMA_g8301.t1 [Chlamydomonas eustigma]|uniref:Germin-like protein n=1 Tax=Chlamydomonas eustigma TaxID=1157962 RepID=A0A250XCU2_9CHLO|nr:hypothetical protein CEUSTIGMA_g8301.t1 [Chlamydomonas eustigma]|eukprot:GAX80866.1 hypothetical protein CEUSTIGMA_g8301.t1 [Chlamydomonas eustigma]
MLKFSLFISVLLYTCTAQNNVGLAPPQYNLSELVNDMITPQVGPVNGTLGTSSVFLSSMPASGSTLGRVVIAPCTTVVIHSHPRGTEQSMVLKGLLTVGYFFENGTSSTTVVHTGDFMVFPEGINHFQSNHGCESAAFAVSFTVLDPGSILATTGLATIPYSLQSFFFNQTFTAAQASQEGAFVQNATCLMAYDLSNDLVSCSEGNDDRHNLSDGAIVGISMAGFVTVAAAGVAVYWFLVRKRMRCCGDAAGTASDTVGDSKMTTTEASCKKSVHVTVVQEA